MKNTSLFTTLIALLVVISCNNPSDQIKVEDMLLTTHQIVSYKNYYLMIQKPMIEGDGCSSIQLVDKNLFIIDEILFSLGGYPDISIVNDSIFIQTHLSMYSKPDREALLSYAKQNKVLGRFYIQYLLNKDYIGVVKSDRVLMDSIYYDSRRVVFYRNKIKIAEKDLEELFFNNNCFYYREINDSILENIEIAPLDKRVFKSFFASLFDIKPAKYP